MSLRYVIDIDNAELLREEPTSVVPRYPAPEVVEFRPGANMASLVEDIVAHDRVQLSAGVSAGKSVRVPEAICTKTKTLVVHCFPSPHMALNLYRYVSKIVKVPTAYVDGWGAELPTKGIVFMGGATLMSLLIRQRWTGIQLPKFILFYDECHESDAFTNTIRDVACTFDCVVSLVLSSATFDPQGGRKGEPSGKRVERVLPDIDVTDWDPEDLGQPWSIDVLDNDSIVYVERPAVADKLARSYTENGYHVRRLYSRMPVDEFAKVLDLLEVKNRPTVVLLADYSFRSNHTFPTLRHYIDSGEVKYYGMHDGVPTRMYRKTYQFENVQTVGRAGRIAGTVSYMWSPAKCEPMMCDLEGAEVDAAVILYRILGFKPPRVYSKSRYYDGMVPDDISEAFSSKIPLFAWPEARLTTWVGGKVNLEKPVIVCDPVSRPGSSTAVRPKLKLRSSVDGSLSDFYPPTAERESVRPIKVESEVDKVDLSGAVVMLKTPARPHGTSPVSAVGHRSIVCDEPVLTSRDSGSSYAPQVVSPAVPRAVEPVMLSRIEKVVQSPTPEDVMKHVEDASCFDRSESSSGNRLSQARSGDLCDARFGFSDGMRKVFSEVIKTVGVGDDTYVVPPPGVYAYYPGVENVVSGLFHGGVDEVHRLVRKQTVVDGWSYGERVAATKVLLDEHNMATARYKAVERLASSLPDVQKSMDSLVSPRVIGDWVKSLSEKAVEDKSVALTCHEDVLRLFPHGLVLADKELCDAYGRCEIEYVKIYVSQFELAAGERTTHGQVTYAAGVRRPPDGELLLEGTKQKLLLPSEYSAARKELNVAVPARSKELVLSGGKQTRTVAKYKLAPTSGLPSLVARAFVKAVGEGDVQVVMD